MVDGWNRPNPMRFFQSFKDSLFQDHKRIQLEQSKLVICGNLAPLSFSCMKILCTPKSSTFFDLGFKGTASIFFTAKI